MCGIAGFNWKDQSLIEKMTKTIAHRGPDDEGFYLDDSVSLGHRRLTVIDLSERGHQPMSFRNLVISYNGEIFNFKQLKEELLAEGYSFASDTDTEVILCSYDRWGPSCVEKFIGMWAFCIYDTQKRTLFLSRDRFGIKPLYYYFDGDKFIFASELKAIRECNLELTISIPALNFFFYQKYIGADWTIFKNCFKLRPSENLLFEISSRRLTRTQYYNLEQEIAKCEQTPLADRLEQVEGMFVNAVEKSLVADVPVGSFLSGGLDSSVVSAIISRAHNNFKTFSISFTDKSYDELKYSKLVSSHIATDHYYDLMEVNTQIIELLLNNMDEPFGDASLFPTYLLSKIARRRVTVCLSGDGADEVFAGYDTYKAYKLGRYIPKFAVALFRPLIEALPISDAKVPLSFKANRFARSFDIAVNRRHLDWMATFDDTQRPHLLKDNFVSAESLIPCGSDASLLSLQLSDIHNYLAEDILKKVDLASMLNSLEVRVPYLDHRLVPLVLSVPENYRIRRFTTKWLLKRIASAYLPRRIVHRSKKGFTTPITRYIRQNDLIRSFLVDQQYYGHHLLDYRYVRQLLDAHMNRRYDNARELWLVFVFNYWWHRHMTR
jgi:asparagine synthase (glutamine-hydrolysing)